MFCIHCGASLPDNAAFCSSCGMRLMSTEAAANDRPSGRETPPTVCTSCGSNALKRIRNGEYVCEHCGSRFYTREDQGTISPEEAALMLTALFAEADEYAAKGDAPAELRTLLKGLEITADDCSLMLRLGRANWKQGNLKKAREYYQRAEALDPGDPIVYVNIGTLCMSLEQYKEAKSNYEKGIAIIEADPLSATPGDTAVAYGSYALCLGKLGDLTGAKKNLKLAKAKGYSEKSISVVCERLKIRRSEI